MFHTKKFLNRRSRLSFLLSLGFAAIILFGPAASALAASAPNLGAAGTFGVLAETYTNTVAGTSINGDLGYTTGPVVAPTVSGTTHVADGPYALAGLAQATALAVLNSPAQGCINLGSGALDLNAVDIGGGPGVFTPGCYSSGGAMNITVNQTVTLNGPGVYIFKPGGALTTEANTSFVLENGACESDVYWAPVGATTIGANTHFVGNILDAAGISIGHLATLTGRALAFGGTVTTDANTIALPTCQAFCPPITLLPTVLPAGARNSAYSQTITASGGAGPYTFTMTAGTLPTGLSPITSGGVIAGTPTTAGTFTFTVTATDQNGCTGLREYTLVINPAACPPITLLPTILPAGTVNTPYSQTITASGGAGPYTFTMTAGTLPTGLSPITSGGVIAGTPTTAGTFTFTVTATDQNGCTGLREYTLVINPAACPSITLLPTILPAGTVNTPYSQTITASGGAGPYTFAMTAGTLPTGLSPITSGGVIDGTPTVAGTFTFTITATDDNGCTGLREYTLVINPADCPPITLLPTILPAGTVNTPYNRTITASGGAGPYTFTMTSGSLPTGLSPITSGGVIAGTPTAAGRFTFTITATDQNGCTGLMEYTLVINSQAGAIPTLSEWGMIIFMTLLGLTSIYYLRRRKVKN